MLISFYVLFLKTILFSISQFLFLLAFISGILAFMFLTFFYMETSKENERSKDMKLAKKFVFIALVLFGISMLIPLITVFIFGK